MLLRKYLEYCKAVALALALKAEGKDLEAKLEFEKFRVAFGKYEIEIERYYDHHLCIASLSRIFNNV